MIDINKLEKFNKKLKNILSKKEIQETMDKMGKEVGKHFLRQVILLTPVSAKITKKRRLRGNDNKYIRYKNGKIKTKRVTTHTGGTLRRGWVVSSEKQASQNKSKPTLSDISKELDGIKTIKKGKHTILRFTNPVSYAKFVNYGHRMRDGRMWTGYYFVERAEKYVRKNFSKITRSDLEKELREILKGGI